MAMRKEDAAPELKDFQIGVSWVPTTPAKPNSTKQQLICTEGQENPLVQANWVESGGYTPVNHLTEANLYQPGRLTGDSLLETQRQTSAACYSSTPLVNLYANSHNSQQGEGSNSRLYTDLLSDFDTWQASQDVNSHVYGDSRMVRETDIWPNISFQKLLALADMGNKGAAVQNGLADMSFVAPTRSASTPYSHPQTEGGRLGNVHTHADSVAKSKAPATLSFHPRYDGSQWMMSFGNSWMQDQDSLGVNKDTELSVPNFLMDGSSTPSRTTFNLNSPPRMIADAALSQNTSLQFAPITPEKTGNPDYMQESVTKDLRIDGKNVKENRITTDGVMDLRKNKEKSHLVTEQLCAATSTQLQENYKPDNDKGGTEEADLIKTPPPKTRRKKHRPKVIIEGRNKGTPKSTPRRPSAQQEPTRPKRKYVRRKGVDNTLEGGISGSDSNKKSPASTDNPRGRRKYERKKGIEEPDGDMNKGTNGTTEIQAPRFTRSSCRRSLNFNSDGQARDETPSYFPSSDSNRDSQAESFIANDQLRNVWCSREQVMEKNDMDTFHVHTRSMNPFEEDYLSRPDQHSPSSSPSVRMDQPKSEHMPVDQTVCTRGKCQILFSDVTHDKEVNAVQVIMNPDGTRTTNVPSDSICSSTCLTPERRERGMKRVNTGANVEAELSNRNETRTLYNSLQAYLPPFSQNANETDGTPLYHFPPIYKKKRTEKGHAVSSCSQHIASTSDNHARLERHGLGDSCTKLFTSTADQGTADPQFQVANVLTTNRSTDGTYNGRQVFEDLLALGPIEKIKRRRSKGVTRLRDLSSLLKICQELPSSSCREATTSRVAHEIEIQNEPYTCMEALVADTHSKMKGKKRSKRSMSINSAAQNSYSKQKLIPLSMGPPLALTWKCMSPVDSITEKLNQLDLNAESSQTSVQKQNQLTAYNPNYQEQNSLVPFERYGAVIPYDSSFDEVRRRRPRPKVDLDDETTRVWKLLLENINSEGIDGTDEEKMKWWEEERRVFSGRADSFIARMHLVQGDRRFSPWKGSVVDSVVGVFLTQNVSDHLSSSAFMSMAARFPLESKTNPSEFHDEELSTKIKEPEICELDPRGNFELNEDILDQSVHGEVMTMLQDSKDDNNNNEVNSVKSSRNSCDGFVPKGVLRSQSADTPEHSPVMSRETVTNKTRISIEDGKETEDSLSSQTPEISSQNSADSPVAQTTERSDSCLLSTSEERPTAKATADRFTSSTSFVKLLKMAGTVLHGVYEKGSEDKTSDEYRKVHSERLAHNCQNSGLLETPTFPVKTNGSYSKSAASNPSSFGAPATEFDLPKKDTKFFNSSSTKELCAAERSELTSESASGTTFQNITDVSFREGPTFPNPTAHSSINDKIAINQMVVGNATGQVPEQNFLEDNNFKMQVSEIPVHGQNMMDVTGSTSNIGHSRSSQTKEVRSNKHDRGHIAKAGRPKKEKEKQVEWDLLRKQAQTGGKDRAKTANTMDSVDWDAVRCADVNEIAQTIKERGMNNMLAERIKDFLNRLVREHGSIDLEWLRDVPPDKAKEYLLSIRGLGLKSVECVRLLTLHHLAFPVDTNVGRIAVRLGWVPLQPLPESLQLHLLELYPVLESIQKYLWPRLCKLDQRTLYELHYQLITFGKVFCTKSKPNCNACPMRGECRHFASAFASARLALPAPEEKRLVNTIANRTAHHSPTSGMNTLQLPSPQANQIGAISGVSCSEPIIEEPPTPEPIIEVPASPEPDYTQVPESDIESAFTEDPDEIPTIQLNMEEFTHNLQKIMQQNTELQEGDMSKALVALASEAASIPVPKLKNVSRLRTEHQVYELPDTHPLLEGMDKREPDDPSPYLLAIWTPGETMDSIEPPERQCKAQELDKLCTDETCSSCNSIREANAQTVRGTLLIPCRTAMRGSFPLNGTYFQVNEVFSDHESSLSPMDVPREWLWNLPRRTVYFGTSIPTIFKGLSTEGIQYCFWRGFVCVRGFDRKTRAPRPLIARLHFPASRLTKGKGKIDEKDM